MKKFFPLFRYSPEKLEAWLNQKAVNGFQLRKWGWMSVSFDETVSVHTRYRIDIDDCAQEPKWERKEQLRNHGWEYVGTAFENFHIYRTESETACMPDEKELRLAGANRIGLYAGVNGILAVLYSVMFLRPLVLVRFGLLETMRIHWILLLCLAVLLPYIILKFSYEGITAWKLSRRLKQNIRLENVKLSLWTDWHGGLELGILISCVIVLASSKLGWTETYKNLSEIYPPIPFVDLMEVEEEGFSLIDISWKEHPDVNFGSRLKTTSVLFAENYYETDQIGAYSGPEYEQVQLSGEYWKVSSNFIAEHLYDQLIRRYVEYERYNFHGFNIEKAPEGMWSLDETLPQGFVEFLVAVGSQENGQYSGIQVFARTEDYVMHLEYSGEPGKADVQKLATELQKIFK